MSAGNAALARSSFDAFLRGDSGARTPPAQEDLDNAPWYAAHGGRRDAAELLLNRGADPAWIGHDNLTAAQAGRRSGARDLAAWLREQGAKP